MFKSNINYKLVSVKEVKTAIEKGKVLWLAGDGQLLKKLPKGRWIGGSIPYFMSEDGGKTSKDFIYVAELNPALAKHLRVKFYNISTISNIAKEAPDHGFTILLIPAFTDVHASYAKTVPEYEDMFMKPIAGWVTGVHLDDLDSVKPAVFNGASGESSADKALAMHISLVDNKVAQIGIVNILKQGVGDTFEFLETDFEAKNCLINGKEKSLADYLDKNKVDLKRSLVADYSGAMINVSFREVKKESGVTSFYAPVFKGVEYKLAEPVNDYVSAFQAAIPDVEEVTFSCNCVLNYLYSDLEGKKTGNIKGPMTFGEIAYQLLNQTLVYLTIHDM